tara:strand:+ start:11099 stop:11665 length:567 start_codon:yes stop_codon:yes gene_type:complete
MTIALPLHNIRIINFDAIFKSYIQTDLLNELHEFGLIKDDSINIKHKDVKRLLYHHIIHGLCEHILALKCKERVVIFHYVNALPPGELRMYVDHDEYRDFINKFILRLTKMLPVKFIFGNSSFNSTKQGIKNTGEHAELVNTAKHIIDKFNIGKYNFNKIRYFAKKYGLQFLSNNFFKKVCNKQLIMR